MKLKKNNPLNFIILFLFSTTISLANENNLEVNVEQKRHPIYDTSKFFESIKRQKRKPLKVEPHQKIDHPLWEGVRSIPGKSTDRYERKVVYPDYHLRRSNLLRPTPISNNLQIYPFTASIPFEGSDLLNLKEFELSWTQTFFNSELKGNSATHQLNMDNWIFEQVISFGFGLPKNTQFSANIPLYHFNGRSTFSQNGFEMIALTNKTRNFWGAPSISLKKLVYNNAEKNTRGLLNVWFQFPEGNQRGNGGTTSGHIALNAIFEKMYDEKRYQLNFGTIEAGDLNLLNQQVLKQKQVYFAAAATTIKLAPTVAVEAQFHTMKSALAHTDTKDLKDWFTYVTLGVRKHYKGFESSFSILSGIKEMPALGTTFDLRYRW
jgi:hypothetical protein